MGFNTQFADPTTLQSAAPYLAAWATFGRTGPIYQAALEPGGRLLNYAIGALPLSVAG